MSSIKIFKPVVIATALFGTAGAVSESQARVTIDNHQGAIIVGSNGHAYTELVSRQNLRFRTTVSVRMNPPYKVKSIRQAFTLAYDSFTNAIPRIGVIGPTSLEFDENDLPTIVNRSETFVVPYEYFAGPAVERCQKIAARMKRSGHNDTYIYGSDWTTTFNLRATAYIRTTSPSQPNLTEASPGGYGINIICQKHNGLLSTPSDRGRLVIRSASLQLNPQNRPGTRCRIAMQLSIRTSQPGATINYKIRTERGTSSRVFRGRTDQQGFFNANHMMEPRSQTGRVRGHFYVVQAADTPVFSGNTARYDFVCPGPLPTAKTKIPLPIKPVLTPSQRYNHKIPKVN